MSCHWTTQQIDDYELGCLPEADRVRFEAHLDGCEACRKRLAAARAAGEAVRATLRWAEPGAAFARRIAVRAERSRRRRWPAVVAIAAVVCLAVAYGLLRPKDHGQKLVSPPPPQEAPREFVAGAVVDAYGRLVERPERGVDYMAAAPTAVGVGDESVFLLQPGTRFAPEPEKQLALSVLSGTMLGQVARREKALSVELAPEVGGATVRTTGCQFYTAGLSQGGWPTAPPQDIRVHVYSGQLELDLGGRTLTLGQGDSAIVADGVTVGSTRDVEARLKELRRAIGQQALALRRREQRLTEHYAAALSELRAAARESTSAELRERVARAEALLHKHATALERLEDEHPELAELDFAVAELKRLDALREAADKEFGRLHTVVAGVR